MGFDDGALREGFQVDDLFDGLEVAIQDARDKIDAIRENKESISIADMFEMQMLMNHLSQLSEMTTNVVNASHGAITNMARNVKG